VSARMKPTTGGHAGVSDEEPLLSPVQAMPVQFAKRAASSPEMALWLSVLEDALRLATRPSRLGDRARRWFLSPSEQVGSFRFIVFHMHADADAAQAAMRKHFNSGTLQHRRKWLR
jgi:hypothetical protein